MRCFLSTVRARGTILNACCCRCCCCCCCFLFFVFRDRNASRCWRRPGWTYSLSTRETETPRSRSSRSERSGPYQDIGMSGSQRISGITRISGLGVPGYIGNNQDIGMSGSQDISEITRVSGFGVPGYIGTPGYRDVGVPGYIGDN